MDTLIHTVLFFIQKLQKNSQINSLKGEKKQVTE